MLEKLGAKYHVVVSYESQIKALVSNLISGYNRDFQLTKKPVMKSLSITKESLVVTALLFYRLRVNRERCKEALNDEIFATEKVYELVKKGVPFREAYQRIAKKF